MTTPTPRTTPCQKKYLYFTLECRNCVDLFTTHIGLKTRPASICNDGVQFKRKTRKISHCGTRSPKYLRLGHFTLLFWRGRQRNVQRLKTYVQNHCSAHENFCYVTFSSPSWFANIPYYYPTLLRRVQITRETITNITRYLYSSHSPDRAKD